MKSHFTYKGRPYDFAELQRKWNKERNGLMPELGMIAVNFFQDRFRAAEWTDKRAIRWKKRDPKNKGKHPLLRKNEHLFKSIHAKAATANGVIISASAKYAAAHNFGFKGQVKIRAHTRRAFGSAPVMNIKSHKRSRVKVNTGAIKVRAHTRKMDLPQRQFMGNSAVLMRKFDRAIYRRIDKSF